MQPHRVVVCGSNYGRVYVHACRASDRRYFVDGLLARDSARSRRLAEAQGLMHHQSADELAGRYDLACCALPSSADRVVLTLLDQGLHVLCEHPRWPDLLHGAYERAGRQGLAFHVNGHFVELPAPRAFVERCAEEGGIGAARRLELTCQDRALYAGLDILEAGLRPDGHDASHAETSRGDAAMEVDSEREWRRLRTGLWGVDTAVTVQRPPSGARDGSSRYRVDVRLAVIFDSGTLALQSLAGPVTWTANVQWPPFPSGELWQVLDSPVTMEQLGQARVDANLLAMDRLMAEVETGSVERLVQPERTLRVARAWKRLGDALT